jgi:N-acetylglucosaminyl-diphospho-decaprenol L-rhamnosyltransferase
MASTAAIGRNEHVDLRPSAERLERELDAPSGAFVYVTRECLEDIGLMREDYFLYYEDLDWGLRAKNNIGYCFESVVYHRGGTSIGSGHRSVVSEFSTYLEFRNRFLFIREKSPNWISWSVLVALAHAVRFGVRGHRKNMRATFKGIVDGLSGRTGRPDDILERHLTDQ